MAAITAGEKAIDTLLRITSADSLTIAGKLRIPFLPMREIARGPFPESDFTPVASDLRSV